MADSDPLSFFRRWGAVSIAMLVLGLLIAVPSGLCVGEAVYDLYLSPTVMSGFDRGYMSGFILFFGTIVFAFGLLVVFVAFRSRINPDDE
jgi:cation transporter-like permease